MDFSEHRPKDWSWLKLYEEQLGVERWQAYQNRVWDALDRLRVNEFYDVAKSVRAENRDMFIKVCCHYISSHKDYEFSNDFTKIIRKECLIIRKSTGLWTKKNLFRTTPGK